MLRELRAQLRQRCSHRLCAAAVLVVACMSGEGAGAQSAGAIVVEGNRRVDAAAIRASFHPGRDGRLDADALDAGLKALYASGLFQDVEIAHSSEKIVVRVVEAPMLDRVAFEGNKHLDDKDLAAAVQSKAHGTLLRATVQGDVTRIIEAYHRAGRYDVRVVPKTIARGNDRFDLVFEVSEGAKTTIREISFAGNHAFGAARLKGVIKTTEATLMSLLKSSDVYDPDRVEADRDLLRRFYLSKGYADVRVLAATADFDATKNGFEVTFSIEEGPLYRFGIIDTISSAPGIATADLRPLVTIRDGATFDDDAVEKSIEAMTLSMAKHGHPFLRAHAQLNRDIATRRMNVTFSVDEGPRNYVERIEVHGNGRTRDNVIRREFDISEGDPYNQVLIDRAEKRLKNLDYFKTVKITTRPGSTPDRLVVDVAVEEQQTGEFSVSGGYSTAYGLIAQVNVGERNFLGTGQYLKASVTLGQYTNGFDVSATEPYLFGTRLSGGIEVFSNQTLANTFQSYNSETYGATLRLGMPLDDHLSVQWRYSLYNQSLSLDPAMGVSSLPIQQAALAGPAWVSTVGDTVTYSTLDNNKSPTSGLNFQLQQDLAGLGGDVNFLRTTADVRYFHPVTDDVVAMGRAQGGYISGWGGQQAPLMDTFFGGPQMVRGFAPNGFGPRDLTPGTTMDNVGGSLYWATTAQLQSTIPGVPQDFGLKFETFADAGSVWGYGGPTTFPGSAQSLQLANSNIVRSSVGVGLVWASPFGSLRVDYAVPVTKAAYDVTQPIYFSAGPF